MQASEFKTWVIAGDLAAGVTAFTSIGRQSCYRERSWSMWWCMNSRTCMSHTIHPSFGSGLSGLCRIMSGGRAGWLRMESRSKEMFEHSQSTPLAEYKSAPTYMVSAAELG